MKSIQKVVETAFSDEENKGIMNFAADLLLKTASPPIKSLVAEVDNEVIGFVSFSPIFLSSELIITGYVLAPLAVSPDHQKNGVGSKLIIEGKQMLFAAGVDILLVYGDPDYYGRFGFKEETARLFVPPYALQYPHGWLGMNLTKVGIVDASIKFSCISALTKPELW